MCYHEAVVEKDFVTASPAYVLIRGWRRDANREPGQECSTVGRGDLKMSSSRRAIRDASKARYSGLRAWRVWGRCWVTRRSRAQKRLSLRNCLGVERRAQEAATRKRLWAKDFSHLWDLTDDDGFNTAFDMKEMV